jgi:hypothetical protein
MSVARSVLPRSAPMLRADNHSFSVLLTSSPPQGGLAFASHRESVVLSLGFSVPESGSC